MIHKRHNTTCVCLTKTEDITLLRLLVEELQPRPNQFMEERGCNSWVSEYSAVAPIILRILSDSDSTRQTQAQGPQSAEVKEGEEEEEEEEEEEDGPSLPSTLPYGDRCKLQLVTIGWVDEM